MSMSFNDYKKEVFDDAKYLMEAEYDFDESSDFDEIYKALYEEDGVTGMRSGARIFSSAKAADNVYRLIWDDRVIDSCNEYGYRGVPLEKGPEFIDALIRCFALDELYDDLYEVFEIERDKQIGDANNKEC